VINQLGYLNSSNSTMGNGAGFGPGHMGQSGWNGMGGRRVRNITFLAKEATNPLTRDNKETMARKDWQEPFLENFQDSMGQQNIWESPQSSSLE
jgi:hypothetical protein